MPESTHQTELNPEALAQDTGEEILSDLMEGVDLEPPEEPAAEPEKEGEPTKPAEGEPAAATEPERTGKPPKGYVDQRALREARKQLRESREETQKLREQQARLDERFRLAREMQEREQAQREAEAKRAAGAEDPEPNGLEDPLGHAEWEARQARRTAEALAQRVAQFDQTAQQQRAIQEFQNRMAAEEAAFTAEHADYRDAMDHLAAKRQAFYIAQGFSPLEARNLVGQEANGVVQTAFQTGKNPASIFYAMATDWAGWKAPNGRTDAAPKTPTPETPPEVTTTQRIEAQRRAQAVAGLGGPAATSPAELANLSAETLATMSEEEFLERMADPASRKVLMRAMQKAEGLE